MPRLVLLPFIACLSLPAWATECPQHYAGGQAPTITKSSLKPRTQELCFRAFAVMHSGVSRTPLWSAEHLVRANVEAAQSLSRIDSFHPEAALPAADRSELSDYTRSGFDRGHMSPNGDMPDRTAQGESFSLANMVPQVHANNAGVWAGIEGAVRQLASRDGALYVVTGPAFMGNQIDSLKGRVLVPTHLWKVIYRPAKGQAGAYLITNDETRTYKSLSVTELERMIGIQLLPGVAQRVRDTAMTLPAPSRESGSRPRNNAPAAGSRDDDFSFMDFVRRTVDTILKKLLS